MDDGTQTIADAQMARQLRRQARKVHVESVIVAVVLTALCLIIPI